MSSVQSNEESQQYHTHEFKLRQLRQNIDKHIWLVCAPKSGSTWLTRIFKDVLKWPSVALVPSFDHREQGLDLSPLLAKGIKGQLLPPSALSLQQSYACGHRCPGNEGRPSGEGPVRYRDELLRPSYER